MTYAIYKTADVSAGNNETLLPISRTDGKTGKSGLCIKVSALSDAVLNVVYVDTIGKQFLINAIDSVRSKVASQLNKDGKQITDDKIGVTAILAAMKADVESQRFTKKSVKAWFDEYLASPLQSAIKEKYAGITSDKTLRMVSDYCEAFQLLASRPVGGKYEMKSDVLNGLLYVLELLPEDHATVTGNEIASRLEKTIEPAALVLALGF